MFKPPAVFVLFSLAGSLAAAPVEILPAGFQGAVQPQVAVAPSGRVHVVFGKGREVFHTTSPDGVAFSAPVRVGELEKLALGMRRGPRVTATDGLVLVTAISHADGNLHAWTSPDAGTTWRESAPLNTTATSAREGLQALAGDGRGLAACVWLDLRNKGMEIWARFSRDGGKTWEPERSVYASPAGHVCECCAPGVAVSASGGVAVMWRNWLDGSRDMWWTTTADGRTFSPPEKLGEGTWKLNACPMDGGGLAYSPAGKKLAVWRRERTVFASGEGPAEKKLAGDSTQPVAAWAGETPLRFWESGGRLMLQRGAEAARPFAENAASASAAGGAASAAVVWEGVGAHGRTLFFDRVR